MQVVGRDVEQHGHLRREPDGGRKLVILVGTDRGLCGSLNTNVFREIAKYDRDTTLFITVGAKAAQFIQKSGRLLVVDFAPHGLEFLRERHAHRRLGFSHETMRAWIDQAGLVLDEAIDLAAASATEQLTVTLWLARDPRFIVAGAAKGLETA